MSANLNCGSNGGQSIVLFTSARLDLGILRRIASRFAWNVIEAGSVGGLDSIGNDSVAAILFDRQSWGKPSAGAAKLLRGLKSGVPLIACLPFSEDDHWEEMRQSGVFHAVHSPLNENEIAQSFGFVWAGERQRQRRELAVPISSGMVRPATVDAAA